MAEEKKSTKKTSAIPKKRYGYHAKEGKEVAVYFIDGKVLKGKLIKVLTYELILEVLKNDEPVEITVFKGAMKYII